MLPLLLDNCTFSQNQTLAPRINVNTAGETVLYAHGSAAGFGKQQFERQFDDGLDNRFRRVRRQRLGLPGTSGSSTTTTGILQDNDVQSIITNQPVYTDGSCPDPELITRLPGS